MNLQCSCLLLLTSIDWFDYNECNYLDRSISVCSETMFVSCESVILEAVAVDTVCNILETADTLHAEQVSVASEFVCCFTFSCFVCVCSCVALHFVGSFTTLAK